MRIGVPKEIKPQENRVGLTPESVKVLTSNGHEVLVEINGGHEAGFDNEQYKKSGAKIIDNAKDQNFIDTDFINEIGTLPDEKPRLEKIIIQVLEKVVGNEYSGILIIDEFDAIAQSGFSDTPQQGTFLLNIVNILNSIKESVDSGKIAKSFCTIFAQTLLSSEEFH